MTDNATGNKYLTNCIHHQVCRGAYNCQTKYQYFEERPQDQWIPVSERLPNRNGVYNVTRKLKEGETIYFISDASYFDGQNTWHRDVCVNHGRPYLTDIIAWQENRNPIRKVMRNES